MSITLWQSESGPIPKWSVTQFEMSFVTLTVLGIGNWRIGKRCSYGIRNPEFPFDTLFRIIGRRRQQAGYMAVPNSFPFPVNPPCKMHFHLLNSSPIPTPNSIYTPLTPWLQSCVLSNIVFIVLAFNEVRLYLLSLLSHLTCTLTLSRQPSVQGILWFISKYKIWLQPSIT